MSRRMLALVAGVVTLIVALTAVYLLVFAGGSDSAQAAVLEHVDERSDGDSAKVLTELDWGNGRLVLVGFERRGVRQLGLAFTSERLTGWQVRSYTEESVEPDDVVVGSLLVASSEGGRGQPAWTAAVGELLDPRIDRVEMTWSTDAKSLGSRSNDAYLVVQKGVTTAKEARYLAKDGAEIARVPVETD